MAREMKRIFHTWDYWESYWAGFFETKPPKGMSKKEAEQIYADFLRDTDAFSEALENILEKWPYSCEHNLTNEKLNRVAWMGQAALAYKHNIPAHCRSGFRLLTEEEQKAADAVALKYINRWMRKQGYPELSEAQAKATTFKAELY